MRRKVNIWLPSDWQPDVAMDYNMEAIRGSLEFQEGVAVASWREHPATQRTWV